MELKWTNNPEYERQKRDHNLRLQGWTQEQIEAMYEEAAATRGWWKNRPPSTSGIFAQLRTQEERDALDARLHGGHNEFTRRIFGLPEPEPEPGKTVDSPVSESGGVSQSRASSPRQTKDISRRTRGGGITKNTAQIQSVVNRGTRSRRAAPTSAKLSMIGRRPKRARASNVADEPDSSVAQTKPHKTRQPKVYKKERASRRLAGKAPEYHMLLNGGTAPWLHENPSRHPPKSRKRKGPSNKKSMQVNGAKPRGISKSGHTGTKRLKKSKKQSGG